MMIIGFCNLKGGVGKTTACQNIAAALAKAGKRVAAIDMDPQSNLSAGFGLNPSPTDPQVFDLLSGAVEWDDVISTKEGIDIVPSSLSLVMAELNNDGPVSSHTALKDALAKVDADRYDYVLLDSPPQLGVFTQNVLAACNRIIVPMDGGFYSLFGLRLLDRSMGIFRERLNPELEIGGILMTNYNPRLYISRKIYEDVRKAFGELLFENYVRQNVSIVEASSMGMSIIEYEPKSKGAECYRAVAEEFLKRFGNGEAVTFDKPSVKEPEPVSVTVTETVIAAATETETEPEHNAEEQPEPDVPQEDGNNEQTVEPVETVNAETVIAEPEPEPTPTPTPDPVPTPAPVPETPSQPKTDDIVLGSYEEGIIQDVLEMLPDGEKAIWDKLLRSVYVSRGELDVRLLREDFEDSDKDRYTFYVLNDESDTLWPAMYSDQIIDPLRCVIKWDENGSAEVYM